MVRTVRIREGSRLSPTGRTVAFISPPRSVDTLGFRVAVSDRGLAVMRQRDRNLRDGSRASARMSAKREKTLAAIFSIN